MVTSIPGALSLSVSKSNSGYKLGTSDLALREFTLPVLWNPTDGKVLEKSKARINVRPDAKRKWQILNDIMMMKSFYSKEKTIITFDNVTTTGISIPKRLLD